MTRFRSVLRIGSAIAIAAAISMLASCATPGRQAGRWISFDAATQRFAIDAQAVPRGALLDELKAIEGTEVRPQPEREAMVTAKAQNLDLDGLLALLLPAGTRATVRPGTRELAAATPGGEKRKQGLEPKAAAGAAAKPDASATPAATTLRGGNLKPTADALYAPHEVAAQRAKPPSATLLRVAGADPTRPAPKQASASRAERATVRLQLEFSDGAAPRIVDAKAIEGRAPAQRIVTGSYLYALVAADGRILDAGTFQDPLIEHSYLPDGTHSEGRARTGVVGISVLRDNLAASTLRVVDVGGVAMPRELDDRAVRAALDQGKPVLQTDAAAILRLVDQGGK